MKPAYAEVTVTDELVRDADSRSLLAVRADVAREIREELNTPDLEVWGRIVPETETEESMTYEPHPDCELEHPPVTIACSRCATLARRADRAMADVTLARIPLAIGLLTLLMGAITMEIVVSLCGLSFLAGALVMGLVLTSVTQK